MGRYRKKPVVIEAENLREDNEQHVLDWVIAGGGEAEFEEQGVGISITTLEGVMLAQHGDYVIKGVQGEFYPCKPDIFRETYEPVDLA